MPITLQHDIGAIGGLAGYAVGRGRGLERRRYDTLNRMSDLQRQQNAYARERERLETGYWSDQEAALAKQIADIERETGGGKYLTGDAAKRYQKLIQDRQNIYADDRQTPGRRSKGMVHAYGRFLQGYDPQTDQVPLLERPNATYQDEYYTRRSDDNSILGWAPGGRDRYMRDNIVDIGGGRKGVLGIPGGATISPMSGGQQQVDPFKMHAMASSLAKDIAQRRYDAYYDSLGEGETPDPNRNAEVTQEIFEEAWQQIQDQFRTVSGNLGYGGDGGGQGGGQGGGGAQGGDIPPGYGPVHNLIARRDPNTGKLLPPQDRDIRGYYNPETGDYIKRQQPPNDLYEGQPIHPPRIDVYEGQPLQQPQPQGAPPAGAVGGGGFAPPAVNLPATRQQGAPPAVNLPATRQDSGAPAYGPQTRRDFLGFSDDPAAAEANLLEGASPEFRGAMRDQQAELDSIASRRADAQAKIAGEPLPDMTQLKPYSSPTGNPYDVYVPGAGVRSHPMLPSRPVATPPADSPRGRYEAMMSELNSPEAEQRRMTPYTQKPMVSQSDPGYASQIARARAAEARAVDSGNKRSAEGARRNAQRLEIMARDPIGYAMARGFSRERAEELLAQQAGGTVPAAPVATAAPPQAAPSLQGEDSLLSYYARNPNAVQQGAYSPASELNAPQQGSVPMPVVDGTGATGSAQMPQVQPSGPATSVPMPVIQQQQQAREDVIQAARGAHANRRSWYPTAPGSSAGSNASIMQDVRQREGRGEVIQAARDAHAKRQPTLTPAQSAVASRLQQAGYTIEDVVQAQREYRQLVSQYGNDPNPPAEVRNRLQRMREIMKIWNSP